MYEGYLLTNSYSTIAIGRNLAWNEEWHFQALKTTGSLYAVTAIIANTNTVIIYSDTIYENNKITTRYLRNGSIEFNKIDNYVNYRDRGSQLYYETQIFPSSNWVNFNSLVPNIGSFANIENALQHIATYIPTPTFDLDVYTQGNTNTLVSFVWSNLQNAVEDRQYFIYIQAKPPIAPESYYHKVGQTEWANGSFNIDYEDLYNIAYPNEPISTELGILVNVQLFHWSTTTVERIIDDEKQFLVTYDGQIEGEGVDKHEQESVVNDDNYNDDTSVWGSKHRPSGTDIDNLMSTTYEITKSNLRALATELWSSSFADDIKRTQNNPIENVVSIKTLPFELNTETAVKIKIGNIITDIDGSPVRDTHTRVIGTHKVPEKYHSFLDYEPYTSVSIYLPYIGVHDLPTNIVMNNNLTVEYAFDIVTGACCVLLSIDGTVFDVVMGNIAIDLPISAQNRAQVELQQKTARFNGTMGTIQNAVNTISNVASGNIIGGLVGGAISQAQTQFNEQLQLAQATYHTTTKGAIGSQLINFTPNECYLIIDRPNYTKEDTYAHDYGYPCNLSCTLSNLKGFTQVSHSVELTGIPCTEQERTEIRNLLTGGVYL